jgi:hypothetical protein
MFIAEGDLNDQRCDAWGYSRITVIARELLTIADLAEGW